MSEKLPLSALPSQEDFDGDKLYNLDGSVNFEAVLSYLSNLGDAQEESERPLEGLSMATGFHVVDMPSPSTTNLSPDELRMEVDRLRREDPIGFAINALIRHVFAEGIEAPTLPVSEKLLENHDANLQFSDEVARFFAEMERGQKAALQFMRDAQKFMETPRNRADDLGCIVAIPVAGHQEYGNIFHTLEQFAKQDLPTSAYEVVLYLNLPGKDGENDETLATDLQRTLAEIQRFKAQYPDVEVRHIVNTYRGDPPPIGTIRADLWGTIAYDMTMRERSDDIMVISADADIINLNSNYLTSMVETFNASETDMVTAHLRWQPIPGLPYDATANRVLRYQSFLDNTRDRNSNRLHTADANTGISLAAYLAVGGYNRLAKLGEMRGVVSEILYYRQAPKDRETQGYMPPERKVQAKAENAILRTHSRRLVKAMALGRSPYSAWDQDLITFGADDSLRTEDMQARAAEESAQENWKTWIKEMTGYYMGDIPTTKKRRILKAARKILQFADLYKP